MAARTCGVCGRDIARMSAAGRNMHETSCLNILHGASLTASSDEGVDDDSDHEQEPAARPEHDEEERVAADMMEEEMDATFPLRDDEPLLPKTKEFTHVPFPALADYKLAKVCCA